MFAHGVSVPSKMHDHRFVSKRHMKQSINFSLLVGC
jgi:hypothetical protein